MPRNGSGVFSAPPGTLATTQTTIESSKYNAFVNDLVSDANNARPITAGGTGATTAVGAIDALTTKGTAIASASTTDLSAATGRLVHITGTTTITAFGTADAGVERELVFDGELTLTHNATSLILPGGGNIRTAAGDAAVFVSEGSGNWRCVSYQRKNGLGISAPLVGAVSANTTITLAERGNCISVDASGGARTITLPAATDAGSGFPIIVKKSDSSANTVTIDAAGSETIDGATTKVLRIQYQSMALVCDGSRWHVLSEGSIFETGSSANGDYIKYANGWAICTKSISPGLATASASGNIFISSSIAGGSLPITFASVPIVTVSGTCGSGNGWTLLLAIPTTTTWGTYRHASAVSDANTGGVLYLTAVGRWF